MPTIVAKLVIARQRSLACSALDTFSQATIIKAKVEPADNYGFKLLVAKKAPSGAFFVCADLLP
jgi:hypothetical protein